MTSDGQGWGVGLAGRGLASLHADSRWTPLVVAGAQDLLDVIASGDRLIAVGRQGGLWIRDTPDSSWRPVVPEGVPPFFEDLRAIAFDPSAKTGYIVGDRGRFFLSRDSGASWDLLSGTRNADADIGSR